MRFVAERLVHREAGRTRSTLAWSFYYGLLMLGWSGHFGLPSFVQAQVKPAEGESVKVFYLSQWFDGTVIGSEGDKFGVRYDLVGRTKQGMFERQAIRLECEQQAMDLARTWANESGQFKIDAALKEIQGEQVVLIKLDLTEITVPLASLSKRDVTYVTKFQKEYEAAVARGQIPGKVPPLPEVETFSSGFGEFGSVAFGEGQVQPLGAIPAFLKTFRQAGLGFKFMREQQELVAVMPVGGPEQLVLVSVKEDKFFKRGVDFPNQLYWLSLKQQKVVGTVFIASEAEALDYDPRSRTLLTYEQPVGAGFSRDPGILTAWRLNPGETSIEPLVRWEARVGSRHFTLLAKVINERLIFAQTDSQNYKVWDIVDKKELYAVKARSFFDAPLIVTQDRQHLLVPEDGYVTVLDATTGKMVFQLKVPSSVSGLNVNDSGTRLAALTAERIYVWKLDAPDEKPQVYEAPLVGNPFRSRLDWLDDDHLLLEGFSSKTLFRLSLELPVWTYEMDVWERALNSDPLRSRMVNGHVFYAAQPDRFGGSLAVGVVRLPGPSVAEVTEDIQKESLYILKPGVAVTLGTLKVSEVEKVRQWIGQKVKANGWVLSDDADIVIDCEMGQLSSRTETYSRMGGRGGETSVTYSPYFANLRIRQENATLWQSGVSTSAPAVVNGVDVLDEVKRMQVPQLGFFETVEIPQNIIDPKYGRGFGKSQLGLRGIVVVSTSPVGREENPEEAQRQANEGLEKARKSGQGSGEAPGAGADGFGPGR
jgi:hypothetical protein